MCSRAFVAAAAAPGGPRRSPHAVARADHALLLARDHAVALATPADGMRARLEFQHVYGRFIGRAGESS